MSNDSRTNNSIRNSIMVLCEQMVYNVLSFICRTVFIYSLGKTYLGFSGLFSDILSLLSLGELGVGTAITYSMYKPAAEGDYKKLAALLNLYKRVYTIIGIGITIAGLCLTPFLGLFISDIPDIPELPIIYILYLLSSTSSYFFVYKKSILITDQKSYIASLIYIVTISLQNICQIVILLLFKNFIFYLVLQVLFSLINNISISIYVDKHYIELKEYGNEKLSKGETKVIYDNIKAMFLSKLSSAVVTSTDNLIISTFVSTITLGLYSNYTLFVTMFRNITIKIFEALHGSVGNLIVLEKPEKIYQVFKELWFTNFWLVSFCASGLYVLINPFIKLWVGDSYLLGEQVVFIICLNLYMRLIRNTFLAFIDTYGLFKELRWKCIAEALINLITSLIFVINLDMGIYGVLLGTFVSNILTNFWYEPYLLFVKKFNVSLFQYFKLFFEYFLCTVFATLLAKVFCDYVVVISGWLGFAFKLISCCVIINGLYVLIFHKTSEFEYLLNVLKNRLKIK